MNDTDILSGLQALVNEHMRLEGTGMDISVGAMHITLLPPAPLHDPKGPAAIISGPPPDLRVALIEGLRQHIPRLVTRRLIIGR